MRNVTVAGEDYRLLVLKSVVPTLDHLKLHGNLESRSFGFRPWIRRSS